MILNLLFFLFGICVTAMCYKYYIYKHYFTENDVVKIIDITNEVCLIDEYDEDDIPNRLGDLKYSGEIYDYVLNEFYKTK